MPFYKPAKTHSHGIFSSVGFYSSYLPLKLHMIIIRVITHTHTHTHYHTHTRTHTHTHTHRHVRTHTHTHTHTQRSGVNHPMAYERSLPSSVSHLSHVTH